MRSSLILRTGLLLVACTLPALAGAQQRSAAGPRALSVGLGGGGVVPVGDFANDVKTGWQLNGHLQYQPATEGPWAVRVEALYTRSNLTDDAITAGGGLPDQKWTSSVLYAGVAAPYYISGRAGTVRPYVIGGLGLYSQTVKFEDTSGVTQSTTESGFGFNGGAGIRFGRAMGFFVEARFHQFSITPDGGEKSTGQFIPVSFGFTF
ncbi:MAG: outer membrane beta-barrel protein [Gemmatimonadaceae bacterium]